MENKLQWLAGGAGAALGYLFGGWDTLLGVLLAFVVADYATGLLAAAIRGELRSKVGYIGIARKMGIGVIVAAAHLIDLTFGTEDMVRDGAVLFYIANEALSIIENTGRLGVPIPAPLRNAVEVLKKKGGAA